MDCGYCLAGRSIFGSLKCSAGAEAMSASSSSFGHVARHCPSPGPGEREENDAGGERVPHLPLTSTISPCSELTHTYPGIWTPSESIHGRHVDLRVSPRRRPLTKGSSSERTIHQHRTCPDRVIPIQGGSSRHIHQTRAISVPAEPPRMHRRAPQS